MDRLWICGRGAFLHIAHVLQRAGYESRLSSPLRNAKLLRKKPHELFNSCTVSMLLTKPNAIALRHHHNELHTCFEEI